MEPFVTVTFFALPVLSLLFCSKLVNCIKAIKDGESATPHIFRLTFTLTFIVWGIIVSVLAVTGI